MRDLVSLLMLMLQVIVIGVILYLVNRFIPMHATIKSILNWVVILALILWLAKAFGLC